MPTMKVKDLSKLFERAEITRIKEMLVSLTKEIENSNTDEAIHILRHYLLYGGGSYREQKEEILLLLYQEMICPNEIKEKIKAFVKLLDEDYVSLSQSPLMSRLK